MIALAALLGKIVICCAKVGFRLGNQATERHMKIKLTSMEVTMISIPRKKSPAKWLPKIPREETPPLKRIAGTGVWNLG